MASPAKLMVPTLGIVTVHEPYAPPPASSMEPRKQGQFQCQYHAAPRSLLQFPEEVGMLLIMYGIFKAGRRHAWRVSEPEALAFALLHNLGMPHAAWLFAERRWL